MKTLASISKRGQNSFGVVRLVAATLVVLSHSFAVVSGEGSSEPLFGLTGLSLGAHAVHMFFVLSGFLIVATWVRRPQVTHFLAGRFLRIFPGLVVVTAFAIVIAALVPHGLPSLAYILSVDALIFFARTALAMDGGGTLPFIFEDNPYGAYVMPTVWTIRYEVICYLTIPIFAVLGFFREVLLPCFVTAILILTGGYLVITDQGYHEMGHFDHFCRFIFAFYIGVAAWLMRHHLRLSAVGLGVLFLIAYVTVDTSLGLLFQIVFVGYLTFFFGAVDFGPITSITERDDLSYGIYVIGYPMQQVWMSLLPVEHYAVLVNFSLSMLVTAPLALLSWRLIEARAMRQRALLVQYVEWFIPAHVKASAIRD